MCTIACPSCEIRVDSSTSFCSSCQGKISAVRLKSKFESQYGDFFVLEKFAEDAVSTSFLVQASDTRRKYVLREYLPPAQTNRFAARTFDEAVGKLQTAASRRIIKPSSYFTLNSRFYTTEETVAGATLFQELRAGKKYSESEVFEIAREISEILSELHTGNPPIYHGDINPASVIRNESGSLMLTDFATLKDATQVISSNGHRVIATKHIPTYQPTERRDSQVVSATDVYTLGVMMAALLSSKPVGEMYDETKSNWDWQWITNESTRLLLEAMTLGETTKRLQSTADVFPVLDLIKTGQRNFDNGQYYEAASQWKQAYDRAKTPTLKSKIETAESRLTTGRRQQAVHKADKGTPPRSKRPFQEHALIVASTNELKEEARAVANADPRVLNAVRTDEVDCRAVSVSAPETVSKVTIDPDSNTTINSGEIVGNAEARIDPSLLTNGLATWLRKHPLAWVRRHPYWDLAIGIVSLVLSVATIVKPAWDHWWNQPPTLSSITPFDQLVTIGDAVVLSVDAEDPDSKKLTFDWDCTPPGKIEGNEKHDSKIVRISTAGLTEVPEGYDWLVSVIARDQYAESKRVYARVWIKPKKTTPKLGAIEAIPPKVRAGQSVNLKVDSDCPPPFEWKCEPAAKIIGDGSAVVLKTEGINPRSTRELLVSVTVTNKVGGKAENHVAIPLESSRRNGSAKPISRAGADPSNSSPMIGYFQPNKLEAVAGERVTITAAAVDPNNDGLTYEWEPRQYIENNGATAVLNTSEIRHSEAYPVTITLTVKDGRGGSASQRVVITVKPSTKDKKE